MDLLAAWTRTCRGAGVTGAGPEVRAAGERLLAAYGGPDRVYHDLRHLAQVLTRVDELTLEADDLELVRLAAWFHDSVYLALPAAGQDTSEERSARLAEWELAKLGLPAASFLEVARLVRLTASHSPAPGDRNGAVLCDADLAVLAGDRAGYAAYVADVRREYAAVTEPAFRTGRAAVLRGLLEAPALFRTGPGQRRWEAAARENLTAELRGLQD